MSATLAQVTGPAYTRIYSYGAARGENAVPNEDLIGPIDSSDEWIRQRTGIITRVRADKNTDAIDLAAAAASEAIEKSGVPADQVDLVLQALVVGGMCCRQPGGDHRVGLVGRHRLPHRRGGERGDGDFVALLLQRDLQHVGRDDGVRPFDIGQLDLLALRLGIAGGERHGGDGGHRAQEEPAIHHDYAPLFDVAWMVNVRPGPSAAAAGQASG